MRGFSRRKSLLWSTLAFAHVLRLERRCLADRPNTCLPTHTSPAFRCHSIVTFAQPGLSVRAVRAETTGPSPRSTFSLLCAGQFVTPAPRRRTAATPTIGSCTFASKYVKSGHWKGARRPQAYSPAHPARAHNTQDRFRAGYRLRRYLNIRTLDASAQLLCQYLTPLAQRLTFASAARRSLKDAGPRDEGRLVARGEAVGRLVRFGLPIAQVSAATGGRLLLPCFAFPCCHHPTACPHRPLLTAACLAPRSLAAGRCAETCPSRHGRVQRSPATRAGAAAAQVAQLAPRGRHRCCSSLAWWRRLCVSALPLAGAPLPPRRVRQAGCSSPGCTAARRAVAAVRRGRCVLMRRCEM